MGVGGRWVGIVTGVGTGMGLVISSQGRERSFMVMRTQGLRVC